VLLVLTIIIPTLIGNSIIVFQDEFDSEYPDEDSLFTNTFTKDNYSQILTEPKYGLGDITIENIQFNAFELGLFNENVRYPLIIDEHFSKALTMKVKDLKFIKTISPAARNFIGPGASNKITNEVLINESLGVWYNYTTLNYLIYHSRFIQTKLVNISVNNGTLISHLIEGVDYTIDSNQFLVFNYKRYFRAGPVFNFTMYIVWEVPIAFGSWEIRQQNTIILNDDVEQEVTAEFSYQFVAILQELIIDLKTTSPVFWLDLALTVNLPNKDLLTINQLFITNQRVDVGDYLNPDKSISVGFSDHLATNLSAFSLNFTCPYNLRFEDPIEKTWAIDRLVAGRNLRQRIYFPTLLSGPNHIYLSNVLFNEPTINFEQIISNSSLFERKFWYTDANDTVSGDLGIYCRIVYLYVGETCPSYLRYYADQDLRIIITDNIKMPLIGANLKILYFGAIYGTFMSNDIIQPAPIGRTNENGELVVRDVPNGNYTLLVYYQNKLIKQVNITTDKVINYIYTDVLHFPLWILIFGTVNGLVILTGIYFYLKNKKMR
ncbi:MAG: hypothetical protein ACFFEO_15285, partial [Candidatus Thorarchaeota archaeon]